tara:strand:- start:55 stop:168 length:114 start_codon:yes stop_codon:yes gene_type:complete
MMRKVIKEVAIRTVTYGIGIAIVASIPFWGLLIRREK